MKTQEQLNKAVETAKEQFTNSAYSGKQQLLVNFIDSFKHTVDGTDDTQEAYIQGQLDYYTRRLSAALDKTLKHFIDEVELTAETDENDYYTRKFESREYYENLKD